MKYFKRFRTVLTEGSTYAYFDKVDNFYCQILVRADDQGNSYIEIYNTEEEMVGQIIEFLGTDGWSVWDYDSLLIDRCRDCDLYFKKKDLVERQTISYSFCLCETCFEYLSRHGEV